MSCCGYDKCRDITTIKGVHKQSVNFDTIESKLGLSFDPSIISSENVFEQVARVTGVNCVPIKTDDETLDVLVSANEAKRIAALDVDGVSAAYPASKKAQRISYDPSKIGSRTLLR